MYLNLFFSILFWDYAPLELKAMEVIDLEDTNYSIPCQEEVFVNEEPSMGSYGQEQTYYIPCPLIITILCQDQDILPLLLKARVYFTCDWDNQAFLVHDSSTKFISNTISCSDLSQEFSIPPIIPGNLYLVYTETSYDTGWIHEPVINLFNNPHGIPLDSFCHRYPEDKENTLYLAQIFSIHIPMRDNKSRINSIIIELEDKRFASYPFFQKLPPLEKNHFRTININSAGFWQSSFPYHSNSIPSRHYQSILPAMPTESSLISNNTPSYINPI